MSEGAPRKPATEMASEARNRVRFEEEALGLADQVYQVARHIAGSRDEAEDLMQETYERAFRSWRSYEPGTNMRAWLLRILTNLNIDRARKKQRRPQEEPLEEGDYYLYNRIEQVTTDDRLSEERLLERMSQANVVTALAEIPHDFRDVMVLVDIGEFSYQEAAQILGIPIGTVMSRLHRARRMLKTKLAPSSEELE